MNEVYVSGQDEILRLAFQTAIEGGGDFYVGLGVGAIPEGRAKTLADVTEVTGTGYARAAVQRSDDEDLGWTLDDGTITSPPLTWENTGTVDWEDADYAFLTLSPEGDDAPTVIFSSSELVDPFILAGGAEKQIVVTFSLVRPV